MKDKIFLTAISFLANFIMAGFASQFGMLIEPIATEFNANVDQVASIFSLLNGGALAGTIMAFFLIDIIGMKKITIISYIIIFLSSIAIYFAQSLWVVNVAIILIGLCGGIGLCIAGTIIVSIWINKIQSTMLVVQDATFNVAGVIFPLITTYALTHSLSWSFSYLMVGAVALITVVIVYFTHFDLLKVDNKACNPKKSEWNFGISSAGVNLFLAMLALYTFLTWAPLFVSEKFSIPFEDAGNIITEYWGAALIGALVSTIIVAKIKIQYFFIMIITLAMGMTFVIVTTDNLDKVSYFTYGYGFVCAALYNASIAYGVIFVKNATSKNISFILISGSTGAMFSPTISAVLQKYLGTQMIMNIIPIIYVIIIVSLLFSTVMITRKKSDLNLAN